MANSEITVPTSSRSELRQLVHDQLELLLEQKNYEGAKALLVPVQPVDVAEAIEGLPKALQCLAFRLLSKAKAIEVYEYLESEVQQVLIQEFGDQNVIEIVNSMSPDDRAKLFDELPPKVIRRMLSQLNAEELQSTSLLLGYRADTAGRIMTPEYISVKDSLTVAQAQQKIRDLASKVEVSYYVYVTDAAKRLIGTVSLRDLVLADPEQTLAEVMTQDIVYAYTDTDQEEVAQMIQRYDLLALPIVDREHNLLGAVTVDDTLDILQQETTEDIYTMGAVQAEGSNYFQSSLLGTARKRLPWLLILLLTNAATVLILKHHEAVLTQVITLTFFAPMLIDAGGNVGAQSATVVIRGLSTDELRNKKPLNIVLQELLAGSLLGTLLGGLVMLVVLLWMGLGEIAVIMGISLLAICAIAAAAGAALPYLCKTLGFDPALMSAPFITTIVDVVGILIYLNTAKLLLGI